MTTELLSQLQAALGGPYTVERELGGGGMSRVFLATEAALNRAEADPDLQPVVRDARARIQRLVSERPS